MTGTRGKRSKHSGLKIFWAMSVEERLSVPSIRLFASHLRHLEHNRDFTSATHMPPAMTKPNLCFMVGVVGFDCLLVLSGNLGISTSLRKLGLEAKSTHHVRHSHLWACSLLSPHLSASPVYRPPSEAPSPAHSHAFRYCPFQEAGFKHRRVPGEKLGSIFTQGRKHMIPVRPFTLGF